MAPDLMVSKPPPSPKFFGSESMVRKLEFLASGRNTTTDKHKEPPDPSITGTPTSKHVWKSPPSQTTAPATTIRESRPRPRLEPPRFTGEDASNWIQKIQRYFDHSYTPESDRFYLVTFLFDPPASDWETYWKENNTGKGWNDFLIAVKHRFDPNFYEDYASNKTTIKPSDSPAIPSDTSGWRLPPSLTQPPTGKVPVALPRPHFDAPRFDGENVVEWIRNIQRYYNHCYTPLSDRLYLTKYLFDQPASDWMTSWKYNHAGENWDDFLLAVYHRFAPEFTDDDVSHVVDDNQLVDQPPIMESTNNIVSNGIGFDTINCYEKSETINKEVFAPEFFDETDSCGCDQLDALTLNEFMDSSRRYSNTFGMPQDISGSPYIVEHSKAASSEPIYEGADCILDSNIVLDEKMARRNIEECRKQAMSSVLLNLQDLMVSETMEAGCNKRFHENDYGRKDAADVQEFSTSHLLNSSFETANHSPPPVSWSTDSVAVAKSSCSMPNLYALVGFAVDICGLETVSSPTTSAATIKMECSDNVDDYQAKHVVSQPHHLASSISTLDKPAEVYTSLLVSFNSKAADYSPILHFGSTTGVAYAERSSRLYGFLDGFDCTLLENFECVPPLLLPVAAPPAASSLTANSFTEVQLEPRATVYGSKATALALNNHDSFMDSLAMALPNSTTASQHNRSLVTFFGDSKQRCEDLRLGAVEGVHIFDPGVFKRVETIQVTYSVVESEVNDKIIGVVSSICSVGINALISLVEYLGSLGILCLFIDKFIEKVENVVTRGSDIDLDVVLSPFGISFGDKSRNGEFVVIVYRDINYGGGLVPYVRMDSGCARMMADVLTDFLVSKDSMTKEVMQGLPGLPMTTNHNRSHVEYNIGDTVPLWICLPPLSVSAPDQLPRGFDPSRSIVVPVKATAEQIVSCDGVLQHQWLVHWSLQCSSPPWELRDALLHHFPTLSLEDKAIVMEGGVDRDSNLEDRPTKYKDLTPH